MRTKLSAVATLVALLAFARPAAAFCGFYVSGADQGLFNNATQVVLMRDGTRTVLSMENNYQGPPKSFAMVVPVPVVLQKENVKTLPKEIFTHVDQLAAPRLVEYWEQDPCHQPIYLESARAGMPAPPPMAAPAGGGSLGVKIEAQFTVGEYDVLILSAQDSTGLDTWLRQEKYNIPPNAEPILRPYVQSGMKFFVAKVDAAKVKFENGMATLSPLRFHYDSDSFALPIRLGLVNSAGTQDLIVHILARGQRYEVANYPNVTIPTNFDVAEKARAQFGSFYAALFDRTVARHPHAVVTEYSWDASSCDPCPTPALTPSELLTLGGDVIPSMQQPGAPPPPPPGGPVPPPMPPGRRWGPWMGSGGFVLTRLHVRYTKDALGDDLVFRAAPPITGGREVRMDGTHLEHTAQASGVNNFQGRYAIRHPWTGPIACKDPQRGIWGGPPGTTLAPGAGPKPKAATNLAFVARNVQLAAFVRGDVPEGLVSGPAAMILGDAGVLPALPPSGDDASTGESGGLADAATSSSVVGTGDAAPPGGPVPTQPSRGCAGCATVGHDGEGGGLVGFGALAASALAAVAGITRRRRRQRR